MIRLAWRLALGAIAALLLALLVGLFIYGLTIPTKWYTGVYGGGLTESGPTRVIVQPPFGPFSRLDVFTIEVQDAGSHLYLLGSDPGGRDLLALVARGAVPSLQLIGFVVVARLLIGGGMGFAIGFGSRLAATIANSIGAWIIGFPYLVLAIVIIETLEPHGKVPAFVIGMALVGWRDVAEVVSQRILYVRSQSFAEASASLGTGAFRFLRLHVMPFLAPLLAIEVPFQASATLVLLAELGYLQVYVGDVVQLFGVNETQSLLVNPELGQLLANTRRYLVYRQMGPVLVPAISVAALALTFELIGSVLKGRWRFAR